MAENWTTQEVANWLQQNSFGKYVGELTEVHKIDGAALLTLTEDDLRQPPLQIRVLGDIKRLILAVKKLQRDNQAAIDLMGYHNQVFQVARNDPQNGSPAILRDNLQHRHFERLDSDSVYSEDGTDMAVDTKCRLLRNPRPEYWKTALSFVYAFTVFLLTAFMMAVSHDRVPDPEKYPPLPDIFLDNMPYVPWAFEICEVIAVIMMSIFGGLLVFHRHRFIILRRWFSLCGTVFLLRSITMFITSLSVPGIHLQCERKHGDIWGQLSKAIEIWKGFGMTLQGVRTCGDYMFSGHTVVLTMLNFFITEYSPRKMHLLHTMSWVLHLFGCFFILAAHEHYSIDVFVAFYISSRLFLYYHSLANNKALSNSDYKRVRIWFPMFSFFESECSGIVPNEYEWPLPWPSKIKSYFTEHLTNGKKRL
ncbi:unnamed protein product [Owenia fusiformis]|uniref:Uncharacterized protein n=1 Tax=Owenia fusiformis TaxID=6347 RepID=A0A8J1UML4_OWEFU|nr:unnamed protein product [Owenia fusiformis]